MKKVCFLLFFMLISMASLFAEVREAVASIPVEFTADKTVNVGFSRSMVSGTIEPTLYSDDNPSGTKIESRAFTVDSSFEYYTTGTFYLYVQLFIEEGVNVVITKHPGFEYGDQVLHYENVGQNTRAEFSGSNVNGEIILDWVEGGESEAVMPRYYNFYFNFRIPVSAVEEALKKTTSFSPSSLTVTVRTII